MNNSDTTEKISTIRIDKIFAGKYQPRRTFKLDSIKELAHTISRHGLVQPIIVKPAKHSTSCDSYEIIAGERRWRACSEANLTHIECIIKNISDKEAAIIALVENIQRENLSALEEAEQLELTHEQFDLTKKEIGDLLGKSRPWVSNLLRLTKLTPTVKEMLRKGQIEATHARAVVQLNEYQQVNISKEIINRQLTVQQVEAIVRSITAHIAQPKAVAKDLHIIDLEKQLSEKYGAVVEITNSKRNKGKIEIEYNSLEELLGIIESLQLQNN